MLRSLIDSLQKLLATRRKKLAAQRRKKDRKFWSKMTKEEADEYGVALLHERGAVASGNFMDKYRAKQAAGQTAS